MAMLKQPDLITSYICQRCGSGCKDKYCISCLATLKNNMNGAWRGYE